MARSKALTVRIPEARLRKLMRARKAKTQSALINLLLAEEEERLHSHRVLHDTPVPSHLPRSMIAFFDTSIHVPMLSSCRWPLRHDPTLRTLPTPSTQTVTGLIWRSYNFISLCTSEHPTSQSPLYYGRQATCERYMGGKPPVAPGLSYHQPGFTNSASQGLPGLP